MSDFVSSLCVNFCLLGKKKKHKTCLNKLCGRNYTIHHSHLLPNRWLLKVGTCDPVDALSQLEEGVEAVRYTHHCNKEVDRFPKNVTKS